ncbi:Hemerythrin HHE cation binding domain-containing protein [Cupriavidus sp. YR651]|uniref:hemerythrin domain-containing protein n=1 Tax=Cupriavidus sp. YR651 TaxID=1855315 RepID=UPI000890F6CC|nr:hemerythrin domain-containing protein [Cupriavidus sp. YR651]SDB99985.1 Hemerythrin HHE cation binding domain-containing protein [Cupriavidus sp. YR651]
MTALIDTMLAEHKQIFAMLDALHDQGISTEAGRKTLGQLRQLVLAHLAREDHKLYPPMHRHDATRKLAEDYEAEMHVISREVLDFFDHYRHGGDKLEFARALGRTIARLRARMTREEIRLYPAFRSHCDTPVSA